MTNEMPASKSNDLLQQWLKRKKGKTGIVPMPADTPAPLSYGQERLWLLQALYPDNSFYNYAHLYDFQGELQLELLLESFRQVVKQHQILRTNFASKAGKVLQVVKESPSLVVTQHDLRQEAQALQLAQTIVEEITKQTFDLTKDALFQITTIRLAEQHHWILLHLHHIIGDRESLGLLNQAVIEQYQKLKTNPTAKRTPLKIQYADYAYWQRQQKQQTKDLNYWLQQLSGDLPILKLPADKPRPQQPTFKGATCTTTLSSSLYQQLQQQCEVHQMTLFVLGLAAFKALLYRYTDQQDLLVGVPFSNRDKVELENLIGFFNETLVMRSAISATTTFEELVQQLKQTTVEAFGHKNIPFSTLVNELKIERQGNINPIFQAMFVFNTPPPTLDFGDELVVEEKMLDVGVSKFDLTLFLTDHTDHLAATFEYATDLFETATIERLANHLEVLLSEMVKSPKTPIAELNILTKAERQQILFDWNPNTYPPPVVSTVLALFGQQVKDHPNETAVAFQHHRLSYHELNQKADGVAQFLQQSRVGANQLVGLFVQPSVELMVGIVGILKAGAAYLPLDPDYPKERIQYMLDDAQVSWVLTKTALQEKLPESAAQAVTIESITQIISTPKTFAAEAVSPDQLAYMIYTSGSTGQPKGVPITHRNLLYSTAARLEYYPQPPNAFLLLSSFAFDSSVAGIFWTICTGGKLVLAPKKIEQDIQLLSNMVAQESISHSLMLPTLYQTLLEFAPIEKLASLHTIMVAGEACPPSLVRSHFQKLTQTLLYNEYGPTEGTVWSTAHQIHAQNTDIVPIGRPIPYAQNYVLNSKMQPVPIGVAGELFIGGAGVAQGYWNRPTLTTERFLPNPFQEGKLYRTGDLVRYQADGTIEFLGRADQQVKIRGHRVELDEIKNKLLQLPTIDDAVVVVAKKGQHPQLVAYLNTQAPLDTKAMRDFLRQVLPAYMLPSAYVELSEFPKLPNGKVNIKALPEPAWQTTTSEYRAPATDLEKQLTTIWQQVLQLEKISVLDSFFDIGGDSIKSIQVIAKAAQADITIAPNLFFEYPNIRALAQRLTQSDAADAWSSIAAINHQGTKTPLFCIHSGAAHVFFYRGIAKYLGQDQPLYALQPKGLDGVSNKPKSIEEMASYYIKEIKRIQPEGPYSLLGTCFSNAVGLEMAHQLTTAGDEIQCLIFVDSGPRHLTSATIRGTNKTASRFGAMVAQGDWKGIGKKIRHRSIRLQQKLVHPFLNTQQQNLQDTIDNLNWLYKTYNWRPIDREVVFIRSTEFANNSAKDYQVEQWQHLSGDNLRIEVVDGHHLTLFEEPEVEGLAKVLKGVL